MHTYVVLSQERKQNKHQNMYAIILNTLFLHKNMEVSQQTTSSHTITELVGIVCFKKTLEFTLDRRKLIEITIFGLYRQQESVSYKIT